MRKLQRKFWERTRRDAGFTLAPFCQDATQMSGGILSLPRPGLRFNAFESAGRKASRSATVLRDFARRDKEPAPSRRDCGAALAMRDETTT